MVGRILIFVFISVFILDLVDGEKAKYDCRRLSDCKNGGKCSAKDGGNCTCESEFQGYNCEATTGTTCTTLVCENGGTCYVLTNGTEKCACDFGYYGSTCINETVTVTCDGLTAGFSLMFPEEFSGTVALNGENIPSSCNFTLTTENGFKTYSLTVSTEQDTDDAVCGRNNIVVEEQAADSNYTSLIVVRYFDYIISNLDELYDLTCKHIGGDVEISKDITNIGVDAQGNLTQVEVSKPYSPIEFEIVGTDGNPLPAIIYVGDSYRICFYLTDTSVYKNVYIKSCSTNNTLEPPDTKTYDIYNLGCPTKKGMRTTSVQEGANKTIEDTTYPAACLPIRAFKFIDSNNLALSCKVQLCKEGNTECDFPSDEECTTIMEEAESSSGTTTETPSATDNTTDTSTAAPGAGNDNSTTAAPSGGENGTTANGAGAGDGNDDGDATTAAPDGAGGDNTTTEAPANDATTAAPNGAGADNTTTQAPANDATTAAPAGDEGGTTGNRRRRRAADEEPDTEEKTVSTVITVYGQRDYTSGQSRGEAENTVENCLSQTEIMAVVTVLGAVVIVLFIACFILICILMRRKSKMTVFEPQPSPKPDRFHIPRAYVNQAYREI